MGEGKRAGLRRHRNKQGCMPKGKRPVYLEDEVELGEDRAHGARF